MSRLATVAVPVPQLEPLTYRLADDQRVVVGSRVLVPLGSRLVTGCVVALADEREWTEQRSRHGDGKGVTLKPVREVLDTEAFLPDEVLQLARWVADYYLCAMPNQLTAAEMSRGYRPTANFVKYPPYKDPQTPMRSL